MHTLILGRTKSGKTTLARAITVQSSKAGMKALILDPLFSRGWSKDAEFFEDVEELIEKAMQEKGKLLVVDESVMSLDKFDSSQLWLAKTSRHNGHSAMFIGQNMADIAKGIRTQCEQIFVLGCSRTDAKNLADEFDDDEILKATKLPKFHFVRILTTGKVSVGRVDPNNGTIFEGTKNNGEK